MIILKWRVNLPVHKRNQQILKTQKENLQLVNTFKIKFIFDNIYIKMFDNTSKFQNLLNKIKHDKNNPIKNDKAIPDVKTTVSAYDRVVQIVTNNESHVHDSKQIKKEDNKSTKIYLL